jgi:hypothetical protein
VENRSKAPAITSHAIHSIGSDEDGGEDEGGVLDQVHLVREVVEHADQAVAAGDTEEQPLEGDQAPSREDPEQQHQRRVPAVPGTERVPDAHHVPLAGGVAPRQSVVLRHDRQLVGGPVGEPQRGGVRQRPARAVGGHGGGALEPAWFHPRPHAQPVLRTHQAVGGRPLGLRASPSHESERDGDDGDADRDRDGPRGQ